MTDYCPCSLYSSTSSQMKDITPESPKTLNAIDTDRIRSQAINDKIVRSKATDEHYVAYGDVSQIWKRQLKSTNQLVAIKGFRMTATEGVDNINAKFEVALFELVGRWKKLDHQNIMTCLGVTLDFGHVASLVMPMCPEGNINEYVEKHSNVSRVALLSEVAAGVAYLHSQGVVHGKICGRNIVIAPNGKPLITDTGLSQVIRSQEGIFPWALPSESIRWMAPEMFDSELGDAFTASADIWSLAMTILEVMSGRMPYYPRRQLHATGLAIMDGVLPLRPDNDTISDNLWEVLLTLWVRNPEDRPCASVIYWQLDALRPDSLHHLYKL